MEQVLRATLRPGDSDGEEPNGMPPLAVEELPPPTPPVANDEGEHGIRVDLPLCVKKSKEMLLGIMLYKWRGSVSSLFSKLEFTANCTSFS